MENDSKKGINKEKLKKKLYAAYKELLYQNEERKKRASELNALKDSLFNEKQLLEKILYPLGME